MSGNLTPNQNIPIEITTGDSATQVATLAQRVVELEKAIQSLGGAFAPLGENGAKAVQGILRQLNLMGQALRANPDVTFLKASAQAARDYSLALNELNIQKFAQQKPRMLAAAARSNDPQRLALSREVTSRQLDAARLQQETVVQQSARAQGTAAVRSAQAAQRKVDALVNTLEARLTSVDAKLAQIDAEAAINRAVQGRVRTREVNRRFAQTPEGQEEASTRQARRDAQDLERRGNEGIRRFQRTRKQEMDEFDKAGRDALSNYANMRALIDGFLGRIQTKLGAFETKVAADLEKERARLIGGQQRAFDAAMASVKRDGERIGDLRGEGIARRRERERNEERREAERQRREADAPFVRIQRATDELLDPRLRPFRERLNRLRNQPALEEGLQTVNSTADLAAARESLKEETRARRARSDLLKQQNDLYRREVVQVGEQVGNTRETLAARRRERERAAALQRDEQDRRREEAPFNAVFQRLGLADNPQFQALSERLRQRVARQRDENTLNDLLNPEVQGRRIVIGQANDALRTQIGLANLGQDTTNRTNLFVGRMQESLAQRLAAFQNPQVVALQNQLNELQARNRAARAVPDAVTRRFTSLRAEQTVMGTAEGAGLLRENQAQRLRINAEALASELGSSTSTLYGLRVKLTEVNKGIAQQATLNGLRQGTPFYDQSVQVGVGRMRQRADVNDALQADKPLNDRVNQQYRNQMLERLTGDGGAFMFQLQALGRLQGALMTTVAGGFTAAIAATVEYDNALKNLQAISASTSGEMDKLKATITGVSLQTRFSATEITEAATAMAQAGLGVREIDKALPSITLMATATGTDLKTAVDIATTALSVFKMRADEMPRVADQMTAALNLSKLTIDQVSLGFQYVGNTAAEAGLSLSETTAVLATLANQGIRSGSTLGTGFRQLLVDLQQPNENLQKRMRELGLTMADVDVRANGIIGVFQNLQRAGFTSADAFATIELRAASAFAAFSRGSGQFGELLQNIQSATGAADANAVQMESLQNRLLQFINTVNAVITQALTPMMNGLKNIVSGVTELISPLANGGEALRVFGTILSALAISTTVVMLGRLVAGLISIPAVMGAVTGATTALTGGLTGATTAAVSLRAAMTAMSAAWAPLAIVALTGAISAYVLMTNESTAASRANRDELNRLAQQTNEAKARADEYRSAVQSLDEFLNTTVARVRTLERDQAALNAQVLEAQNRFGSLSQAVQGNIRSYGDLVAALRTARSEMRALAVQAALTAGATAEVENNAIAARLNPAARRTGTDDLLSSLGLTRLMDREIDRLPLGQRPGARTNPWEFLQRSTSPELTEALRLLTGNGPQADLSNRDALVASVGRLNQLRNVLNLDELKRLGMTEPNAERLLAMLADRGNDMGRALNNLSTISRGQSSMAAANLQGTPAYENLESLRLRMPEMISRMNEANRGNPEQRRTASQTIMAEANEQFRQAELLLNAMAADAESLGDTDTGRAQRQGVMAAVGEMRDNFVRLRSQLREAQQRVDQSVNTNLGERARIATDTFTRQLEELGVRSRGMTNPDEVKRLQAEAEKLIRDRLAVREERILSEEYGPNSENYRNLDPLTLVDSRNNALEGARAQARTETERWRNRVAESLVQQLRDQQKTLEDQIRTAQQADRGGRQRGNATALINDAVRLQQQIADLTRAPEDAVNNYRSRLEGSSDRARFSAGQRAGQVANNPVIEEDRTFQTRDPMRDIDRDTRNAIARTQVDTRRLRNQLEATRLDPNLTTEGRQRELQRQLNEAEIDSQIRQIEIRRTEIDRLTTLNDQNTARLAQLETEIRAQRPLTGTVDGNQRMNDLLRERDRLSSMQLEIPDRIDRARTALEQAQALQGARQRNDEANPMTEGFMGAWSQMREQFSERGQTREFEKDFTTMIGNMRTGFGQFVRDVVTGNKTIGQSFKDFAKNFLSTVAEVAANRLAAQLIGMGISALGGMFGGVQMPVGDGAGISSGVIDAVATGGNISGGGITFGRAYNGGIAVRRFNRGGFVSGAHVGRDTVPAMLAPGEAVLNRRAVAMVGTDMINAMNEGMTQRASSIPSLPAPRDPDQVSVYVMAPNERPTMGPRDVLAVIGEDILTGGQTKQLIRQVAVGGA